MLLVIFSLCFCALFEEESKVCKLFAFDVNMTAKCCFAVFWKELNGQCEALFRKAILFWFNIFKNCRKTTTDFAFFC